MDTPDTPPPDGWEVDVTVTLRLDGPTDADQARRAASDALWHGHTDTIARLRVDTARPAPQPPEGHR